MARSSFSRASNQLAERCPVLRRMVERHGVVKFDWGTKCEPFQALARSICYQQLAGNAARAIHGRFVAAFDGELTPERVLRKRDTTLRACGLSLGKIASIKDLARHFVDGRIAGDRLPKLSDDEIVEQLTQVRGIGEWTAQMFLIFQLERMDVWPVLDYGVRKGFAQLFGHPELPSPKAMLPLGEPYRPYRSALAWYCWRATDERATKEEGE